MPEIIQCSRRWTALFPGLAKAFVGPLLLLLVMSFGCEPEKEASVTPPSEVKTETHDPQDQAKSETVPVTGGHLSRGSSVELDTASPYQTLRACKRYYLLIGWAGSEWKPFWKAVLESHPTAREFPKNFFWKHSTIARSEFHAILAVMESSKLVLRAGNLYDGPVRTHFLLIGGDRGAFHCPLPATRESLRLLSSIENALEADHRLPLKGVAKELKALCEEAATRPATTPSAPMTPSTRGSKTHLSRPPPPQRPTDSSM